MQSDSLVVLELVVKEPDMLLWDRGKRVDERRHRGLRADHAFVQIDHRQHGHEQAGGGEQEIPQRAGEFYVCADRLVDERGDDGGRVERHEKRQGELGELPWAGICPEEQHDRDEREDERLDHVHKVACEKLGAPSQHSIHGMIPPRVPMRGLGRCWRS